MASERSPLLQDRRERGLSTSSSINGKPKLGPMEISAKNRRAILAGIWIATFLGSLNTTLVATLIGSISSEYQSANQASWLGTAYLLATCTFTPLYGRLSNVLGRRGANQTAVFFAGLGVLCCGLSNSLPMLIAARFFGGIGGGGIFTTATIITSDMYTLRERSMTQGIAAIFNGAGMGLGGPLGGYISDRWGWRWAFLIQIPFFIVSFTLTGINLHYVTPGRGKSTKEVLKRIDYLGSATLFSAVGSLLLFLSYKYNEEMSFSSKPVIISLCCGIGMFIMFVIAELFVAPEPVLAPFLLKQRVPVLVGMSNFMVSFCNFSVMYFFPMYFETVMLTSASTAGAHLLPNSLSMSCGSMFAGWVMAKTGRYKVLSGVFGIFPFVATIMMSRLSEDSGPFAQWFSIIPLGFGNAVVVQATLIALLAHVDRPTMPVATGFGQLFRGIGQVSGVAFSSAVFQSLLYDELSKRITGPDAASTISRIRHSSKLVARLEPTLKQYARDSYGIALRRVFFYAACATLTAYIIRMAIPDKNLDEEELPVRRSSKRHSIHRRSTGNLAAASLPLDVDRQRQPRMQSPERMSPNEMEDAIAGDEVSSDADTASTPTLQAQPIRRRLSTYSSTFGVEDLEDEMAGSARQ
ncbi:hypothetical protein M422DRAFT_237141 [Sphaerobolus stellatus SS14]|uniref:Major facilitator superfamily (MFS) profile domain-containing protein n=1 Tax=Sphaerobolus stellatus (strain SS14) TaxID=990650 RepID=A0A0C9TTS8_SPHS4|nr:hypothetical protein M422DRAFT_237141 [Sphaerobolus stellatus SS14]